MSTVGRVIFGKICELQCVNKLYVYQMSVFIIGVSTVICPITEGYAGLVTYSVVFGFFDGCFVGQVAVITGSIAGKSRLSQAVGNMFGVVAIPMILGPPVAGRSYLHKCFLKTPFSFGHKLNEHLCLLHFADAILRHKPLTHLKTSYKPFLTGKTCFSYTLESFSFLAFYPSGTPLYKLFRYVPPQRI